MSVSSIPGFDVLGLNSDGTPAGGTAASPSTPTQTPSPSTSSPSTTSTQQNPYQQSYDSIETWSAHYLMQAAEYGAPPIPQFIGGQSVDSFAQLTNTLAAIQPGVQNGTYGGGTGSNINTTA